MKCIKKEYRIQNSEYRRGLRDMCEVCVCQAIFLFLKHLTFKYMAHFMNFKN